MGVLWEEGKDFFRLSRLLSKSVSHGISGHSSRIHQRILKVAELL